MVKNYKYYFIAILTLLLAFAEGNSFAGEIWLSGNPPEGVSKRVKPSGMQNYYAYRAARGKEKFALWIREGVDNVSSVYIDSINHNYELFAFNPNRESILIEENNDDLGYYFSYDFEDEGFHNIYLLVKYVEDSVLYVQNSKIERISHKCKNGHKSERIRIGINTYPAIVDFELVRQRIKFEDFHTILTPGDKIKIQALFNGKVLDNCKINLSTEKAWSKELVTDNKGIAEFELANDYFPSLENIEKRKTFHMLLSSIHKIDSVGIFQGEVFNKVVYSTKMEVEYVASDNLYKSKVWGVWLFLGALVAFILLVIFLRRKHSALYRL